MLEKVTVVIIARDEAENLARLLPQLKKVGEVLVIDNHSRDGSEKVIKENGARYLNVEGENFAELRNVALAEVKTEWIWYLDADERVSSALWEELEATLQKEEEDVAAIALRRENYFWGHKVQAGGWQDDVVERIFRRQKFGGWTGVIHESPQYEGKEKQLINPLLHLTHRNMVTNLEKSSRWTIREAELLAAAEIGKVTGWTIVRKVVMEWWRRYVVKGGYKDGMVGFVEALVQAFNRGFVYIQVWELQQEPSITDKYEEVERQVSRENSP